ncbi:hypothetical protein QJS10_CPB13g00873 [Acorus calamus]|uniref:DUF4220 domain-containing protein n=1 Tax=Acorus calamus TaxID=4465 RepID=A0AAV9DGY7_ACOCL|nr:hypothetical protein QJS10_CPB13g00873 [Acorus calamus]
MSMKNGKGKLRIHGWRSGSVIWFTYLVADYVATTTALGVLSCSTAIVGGGGNSDGSKYKVTTLPSPLSSGPDTITTIALEDNKLWKRHLVGLISQVEITKSVVMKSGRWNQLLVPTVPMILVRVLKVREEDMDAQVMYGSQDKFREFMEDREMESEADVDELEILLETHNHYHMFRRLIVDQILSLHDRNKSNPFFMKLTARQAFRVIEINSL